MNRDQPLMPCQTVEWVPAEGDTAFDRRTDAVVRVMSVHGFGVFVRPLNGGREHITKLRDLAPPDHSEEVHVEH